MQAGICTSSALILGAGLGWGLTRMDLWEKWPMSANIASLPVMHSTHPPKVSQAALLPDWK